MMVNLHLQKETLLFQELLQKGVFVQLIFNFGNCSIEENDNTDLTYILNISYSGYKIDHQSNTIPLEKNSGKYPFYKELFFSFGKSTIYDIDWGVIKYKEERGLLGLFDNLFNIYKLNKNVEYKILKYSS